MKEYIKKFLVFIIIILNLCVKSFAQEINIAFTIDNKYPLYTLLAINSILINNESNSDYKFWIVENNLSIFDKIKMLLFVKYKKQNIDFINIDTSNIDNGINIYENTPLSRHVSRIGTARLYLPQILPQHINKVLYLDSDILVLSDIKELYDTDISGYSAALAKNNSEYFKEPTDKTPIYYNSGVILINVDNWKKCNFTDKMIDYIKNNTLKFPDQDAINYVLLGKIKTLDQKWNNQTWEYNRMLVPIHGGVIHYIAERKPWLFPDKSPEMLLYNAYWDKSYLRMYKHDKLIRIKDLYRNNSQRYFYKIMDQIIDAERID